MAATIVMHTNVRLIRFSFRTDEIGSRDPWKGFRENCLTG
jgi:hypothetical protein